MQRHLTRAQRLAVLFTLASGCTSVELVGVDRLAIHDAAAPDASSLAPDASSPAPWVDPQRPALLPGQFVDAARCPALEPRAGASCEVDGLQCDYPVCSERAKRSWVCMERRFGLWFDESFYCDPARPCPSWIPSEGVPCSLSIECRYSYFCCKGPMGVQSARCDGQWTLGEPDCSGCENAN
jgi:hypothetical protein